MPTALTRGMAARLLGLARGTEAESAGKLRAAAARMLKGEQVEPGELEGVLPRRVARMEVGGLGEDSAPFRRMGELAVIAIDGPVMYAAGWLEVLFLGVVPTAALIEALDAAASDSGIRRVLLDHHCPGGSVDGLGDVAGAMERLAASGKEVYAIAHDMLCSAAWWWSAGCDEVVATQTGMTGSIGSIWPHYDESKLLEEVGVEPRLLASSKRKGVGFGEPLTDELLSDRKQLIDGHAADLFARVDAGRGKPAGWAQGLDARIYLGVDAVKIGLLDRVVGYDEYLDELVSGTSTTVGSPATPAAPDQEIPMDMTKLTAEELRTARPDLFNAIAGTARSAAETEFNAKLEAQKPRAASIGDLKAAFPGTPNSEFREDCAEKGMTLDQAKAAHAGELQKQLTAVGKERDELKAKVTDLQKLGNEGKGGDALKHGERAGGGGAGGEAGKFEQLVHAKVSGGKQLMNAIDEARRENPEAHTEWLGRGCPKIKIAA